MDRAAKTADTKGYGITNGPNWGFQSVNNPTCSVHPSEHRNGAVRRRYTPV